MLCYNNNKQYNNKLLYDNKNHMFYYKDQNNYIDLLIGGKLTWTIPFEIGAEGEDLFY